MSKGTADSGVVMENREIPGLPGGVAGKPPPLTANEVDTFTQDGEPSYKDMLSATGRVTYVQ